MRLLFEEYGFALIIIVLLVACVALFGTIFSIVSGAYV